jgi:large-conductance mechanosensitive channel
MDIVDRIKMKFFLALVILNWGSLILMALPLLIVAYVVDRFVKGLDWVYSILLGQDHYAHTMMGGHYLTTISSMLGHLKQIGSATGTLSADFVDKCFNKLTGEINHCTNAMQKEDDFRFSPVRAIVGTFLIQSVNYFVVVGIYTTYF